MVGIAIHNSIGMVFPGLVLQRLGKPLALGVGMIPEVEEEEQEDQTVGTDDVDEDRKLIVAVLYKEVLGDVSGHHHKLDLGTDEAND